MLIEKTKNGIEYTWGLAGPDGAWFTLFPSKNHSKEDIEIAKIWLKDNQDVVRLSVADDFAWYDRFRREVFVDPRTKPLHWSQIAFEFEDWKKVRIEMTSKEFVDKHIETWRCNTPIKSNL